MAQRKFVTIFEQMGRRRGQRTGHLFQHRGSWLLRYYVDSPDEFDPTTGKPIRERITVTVAPSEGPDRVGAREAQRISQEEYLSRVNAANMRPSSGKLLQDFVDSRFYPDYLPTLKRSGQIFYRSILKKHVLPELGKVKLRDITVERVQALLTAKGKTGLSTQTVVHVRNCLSAVLRHAKAMQWYFGELPTVGVRLPEMRREARRGPTWNQACQLAAAVPEPISTLVIFLTLTGLRIGEAMGLRIGRLNLGPTASRSLPPFSVSVLENYVRNQYSSLKTAKSSRVVPIPEWFAPRLLELLERENFTAETDPVFVARNGKPLDQHNVASRILKPAARALGMDWISWHCLRHAQASLADAAGFSVSERQKILGHASDAMTMHYTGADLERMRARLEVMVDPKMLQ